MELRKLVMLSFLSVAVGTDMYEGKIYNSWLLTGACFAGALRLGELLFQEARWFDLLDGLAGIAVSLLVLSPLFFLGLIGGGDVKLYAMIGAFVGWTGVLSCMRCALVPAAIYSIGILLWEGSARQRFLRAWFYIREIFLSQKLLMYDGVICEPGFPERQPEETFHGKKGQMYVSVPIFLGVWMYLEKCWVW